MATATALQQLFQKARATETVMTTVIAMATVVATAMVTVMVIAMAMTTAMTTAKGNIDGDGSSSFRSDCDGSFEKGLQQPFQKRRLSPKSDGSPQRQRRFPKRWLLPKVQLVRLV
jgi:hypothetical protein